MTPKQFEQGLKRHPELLRKFNAGKAWAASSACDEMVKACRSLDRVFRNPNYAAYAMYWEDKAKKYLAIGLLRDRLESKCIELPLP